MMTGSLAFFISASFIAMNRRAWSHFGQVPLHPSPEEVHSSSMKGIPFWRQMSLRSSRRRLHFSLPFIIFEHVIIRRSQITHYVIWQVRNPHRYDLRIGFVGLDIRKGLGLESHLMQGLHTLGLVAFRVEIWDEGDTAQMLLGLPVLGVPLQIRVDELVVLVRVVT